MAENSTSQVDTDGIAFFETLSYNAADFNFVP